jgi:hypothetical protein
MIAFLKQVCKSQSCRMDGVFCSLSSCFWNNYFFQEKVANLFGGLFLICNFVSENKKLLTNCRILHVKNNNMKFTASFYFYSFFYFAEQAERDVVCVKIK